MIPIADGREVRMGEVLLYFSVPMIFKSDPGLFMNVTIPGNGGLNIIETIEFEE